MDWLAPARKAKHAGLVGRRKLRRAYVDARDVVFSAYSELQPYEFDSNRHRNRWGELPRMYFLHRDPPPGTVVDMPVPRQIFALWTGANPLTANRQRGLESLGALNPQTPVRLVTPHEVPHLVVAGHPLHPAYEWLSFVHRSDYLRAYLMHHYGGGYSDIKLCRHDWDPAFDMLATQGNLWAVGYPEVSSDRCGGRDPRLGHEIRRRYQSLMGFGAFIFRPGTPLTAEWLREVERRLDYYAGELAHNPGDDYGEAPGYPIQWIELGMDILNPLQLKYLSHIGQNAILLPELTDHR